MTIETKFGVHGYVNSKYKNNENHSKIIDAFEVMEVITQVCYGGTQVFYLCRGISLIYEKDYNPAAPERKLIDIGLQFFDKTVEANGWVRFREDDLKPTPPHIVELINTFNHEQVIPSP